MKTQMHNLIAGYGDSTALRVVRLAAGDKEAAQDSLAPWSERAESWPQ